MTNKILKVGIVILIAMMLFTIDSYAFTMNPSLDKQSVKIGEEVTYKIKLNDKVVATNFILDYDNTAFELVKSNTTGLNVAEKNGKIACIYADIGGTGTDTFEIILKAKKNKNNVKFSIEEAKFRTASATTSYTDNQIDGIEKIVMATVSESIANSQTNSTYTNTTDKTTSKENIPQTGENNVIVKLLVLFVLAIAVNKIRVNRLKDVK